MNFSVSQKALVTGGAGFIGSALIRHLVQKDWAVHCVDCLTYASSKESIEPYLQGDKHGFSEINITNQLALEAVFESFQPTAIFHLAAESHVDRSIESASDFIQTNLVGTSVMLEVFRKYHAAKPTVNCQFIHVSTDEVYGSLGGEGEFSEDSPYRPNSPYSASKAGSDHLARAWAKTYNLPIIITNCSNNFGPFQHDEKLIPTIIRSALKGQDIPIYGTGLNVRDWLYVDDHVDALITIAKSGKSSTQYCIGGGTEYSNIELCRKICALLDELKPRDDKVSYLEQITFVEDRKGHDFRYAINSSKIENELGWVAKQGFEHALKTTVMWFVEKYDGV